MTPAPDLLTRLLDNPERAARLSAFKEAYFSTPPAEISQLAADAMIVVIDQEANVREAHTALQQQGEEHEDKQMTGMGGNELRELIQSRVANGELSASNGTQMLNLLQQLQTESEAKVSRVLRGEFTQICSYCGWESPGPASWEQLQAHIQTCEQHPVVAERARADQAESELATLSRAHEALARERDELKAQIQAAREVHARLMVTNFATHTADAVNLTIELRDVLALLPAEPSGGKINGATE